jgi:hypothetical protein
MRYLTVAAVAGFVGAALGWAAARSARDYDPGDETPVRRYHDASRNLP